jgi:hypothetical protein
MVKYSTVANLLFFSTYGTISKCPDWPLEMHLVEKTDYLDKILSFSP